MNPHRGLLHHMNINVSDLKRSSRFYGPLFEYLGYKRVDYSHEGDWAFEDWKRWLEGTPHEIGIVQAHGDDTYEKEKRRSVGRHNHIAFCAEGRADVDGLYEKVLIVLEKEGLCEIEDPPTVCKEYNEGYYATFFFDPDGMKYEFVFTEGYQKYREEWLAEQSASHNAGKPAS